MMTPNERVRNFLLQMLEWEVGFHAEKRSDVYKGDSAYRGGADEAARVRLKEILSENLSTKAATALGAARLDTLGTGHPPEYEQTVLNEEPSGETVSVESVRDKGLKQRYRYTVITQSYVPKIDEVCVWRGSSGTWERRYAI